jgi:hypothetical protein
VIDEFLTAGAFRDLVTFLLQRQGLMRSAGGAREGVRILEDLGAWKDRLATTLLDAVPDVAPRCGVPPFDSTTVDMRIVSRGLGSAATHDDASDRKLGFVLFLHREPRPFAGGALHLSAPDGESVIEPAQNSLVFFPGMVAAQTAAVRPVSASLIDSRLTLEGSVHA